MTGIFSKLSCMKDDREDNSKKLAASSQITAHPKLKLFWRQNDQD